MNNKLRNTINVKSAAHLDRFYTVECIFVTDLIKKLGNQKITVRCCSTLYGSDTNFLLKI